MPQEIDKNRRNLLALSIAIMVYILGGGEIEKVTTSGSAIKLSRPWVAELFTWIIFIYFLWRFEISCIKKGFNNKFFIELDSRIIQDSYFWSYINLVINSNAYFTEQFNHSTLRTQKNLGRIKRTLFNRKLWPEHPGTILIPLSFFKTLRFELKYIVFVAYYEDNFAGYSLPVLLASIAIFIFYLKHVFKLF